MTVLKSVSVVVLASVIAASPLVAFAGPPAHAIANALQAGINLEQTVTTNAGGGNGSELLTNPPVLVEGVWMQTTSEIDPGKSIYNQAKELKGTTTIYTGPTPGTGPDTGAGTGTSDCGCAF